MHSIIQAMAREIFREEYSSMENKSQLSEPNSNDNQLQKHSKL